MVPRAQAGALGISRSPYSLWWQVVILIFLERLILCRFLDIHGQSTDLLFNVVLVQMKYMFLMA